MRKYSKMLQLIDIAEDLIDNLVVGNSLFDKAVNKEQSDKVKQDH